MSIEEVERILDETQESVEYQRVNVQLYNISFASQLFSIKTVLYWYLLILIGYGCFLKIIVEKYTGPFST